MKKLLMLAAFLVVTTFTKSMATTVYARLEPTNFTYTYEDVFWDFTVRFYSDANYTTPITLTSALTFTVDRSHSSYSTVDGNSYTTDTLTYTIQPGNSAIYLGNFQTEYWHYFPDQGYEGWNRVYMLTTDVFTI